MTNGVGAEHLSVVVERLEAQLAALRAESARARRRQRATWGVLVACAAVSLLSYSRLAAAAGSSTGPRKIVCKQLDLVDDNGKLKAQLVVGTDGAGILTLHDTATRKRLQLQGDENSLYVIGTDGNTRVRLWSTTDADNIGIVSLYDKNQQVRVQLEGKGAAFFDNPASKTALSIGSAANDGSGYIDFFDGNGNFMCGRRYGQECR